MPENLLTAMAGADGTERRGEGRGNHAQMLLQLTKGLHKK